MKTSRPSPSESATLFKSGTIKKGNDGNMWIIKETLNGIKKWIKYNEPKKLYIKTKKNLIIEFQLPSIRSIKKIGQLKIESNVVVGELFFGPQNGFTRYKKGIYYVYRVDDNLVLSKSNLTSKNILDKIWTYTGTSVGVDGGTFGFWDLKYLKALNEFDRKNKKIRDKSMIPLFDLYPSNVTFVKIQDLDNAKEYIEYGFDGKKIIGVLSSTETGDGTFDCFEDTSKSILLLLGGRTSIRLYENLEENMPGHLAVVKKYELRKGSKKGSKKGSRKNSKK